MAGRGRGATLPAWMTATNGVPGLAVPHAALVIPAMPMSMASAAGQPQSLAVSAPYPTVDASAHFNPMAQGFKPTPTVARTDKAVDPSNDVSLWSEHTASDGRQYWYNSATQVSTYDKPFCLKSPEERAVPPCAWKEYFSDGKPYYSDGKQSSWTMPEEYRDWKAKTEAAEKRKLLSPPQPSATSAPLREKEDANKAAAVVYATPEEAAEAFAELLAAKGVSATAKMKDVADICGRDPRWEALRSQGEKRQALAEYQTRKLKAEKEAAKARARRTRDAFLLMLAENTAIDAATDWRSAMDMLREDSRYKAVEDARERAELFADFQAELLKKEKADGMAARGRALQALEAALLRMQELGVLDRRSGWPEHKAALLQLLTRAEYRPLGESDLRRAFQQFVDNLEAEHRSKEKSRRDHFTEEVRQQLSLLREHLRSLAADGTLTPSSRFRDLAMRDLVTQSVPYEMLAATFTSFHGAEGDAQGMEAEVRAVFEAVLVELQTAVRNDKRTVQQLLSEHNMRIGVESKAEDFLTWLRKVASGTTTGVAVRGNSKEEGEEEEEAELQTEGSRKRVDAQMACLREMLAQRPCSVGYVFEDLHTAAKAEADEQQARLRRAEARFRDLLAEHFYRSDHLSTSWEVAKPLLQRRSAYEALGRTDRKRVFADYMAEMASKMAAKEQGLRALQAEAEADQQRHSSSRDAGRSNGRSRSPSRKRAREQTDLPIETNLRM